MEEIIQTQEINGHRLATVLHKTGKKTVVIFCHGYRSGSIGPNRFFVRAARQLAQQGIASFRFDQYGSGNSEGDFIDSSFDDWVKTIKAIANSYLKRGYEVGLLGQSMGGSAVIAAASTLKDISVVVAWTPDASVDTFLPPKSGIVEESGQIVKARFWQEAHDTPIPELLATIKAPVFIVQCTKDEYVNERNRKALYDAAKNNHIVKTYKGYAHSNWTYRQSQGIINETVDFLSNNLKLDQALPTMKDAKLYTDGGSRGNPGPAAIAYVICSADDNVVEKTGKFIGVTTNNQAEYQALLMGLEKLQAMGVSQAEIFMDSELVVKQINGLYKLKNNDLKPWFEKIKAVIADFSDIKVVHVPRALNKIADAEVNRILDEHKH